MFKILVVEGDAELNRQVCNYLRLNGYETTGCLSANDAFNAMYSQSKALATQAVLDAVRERGLNACVMHPAVACLNSQFSQASLTLWGRPTIPKGLLPCGIMGPEDFAMGETTGTMIKIINGEMPAGIDGSFNLCDVRDLADGTIRAAERGLSGECYILGNHEVRFRDFARMIAEEAGTRPRAFSCPWAWRT